MNLRWLITLAFAGVCGVVPNGWAAKSLSLEEAIERSLASNPVLIAGMADVQAVQARADLQGLPTPFVVGGELENVAGSGLLSGMDSAETTLRLGRVIELGGKRSARQALGTAEIARQRNAAATLRVDVISLTTTRFIEVIADQERLAVANEQLKLAERTRQEVASWVSAARNPEADLRAAEIALADAELLREHAQHELASAKTSLAASWGAMQPDFAGATGNLGTLPPVDRLDALVARLPKTAAERNAQLEAEAITARRRLAETSNKPDVDVSLGVRRFEATDDHGLVMSVSMPLGYKPRASLAIAEADAQLASLESRRNALRAETHQQLFEKYQELVHARTEHEALRKTMLPKAEQAFESSRRGFEAGRFSFISLAQSQRTLFDLRRRSVDAAARYHMLLVDIERLTAVLAEDTP